MMDETDVVENFFGVYLLYCINPKYKGRTYIGYTVNPNRRIHQHNRGVKSGGAYKTSNRGPWEMVFIIHGFPNDISALRFEWAWQHPDKSRRLHGTVKRKSSKESKYEYNIRVVCQMLNTNPWAQLPLTIRWLKHEYVKEFTHGLYPPKHMPVAYGPVQSVKVCAQVPEAVHKEEQICYICSCVVSTSSLLRCFFPDCSMTAHIRCLASTFLYSENLILPVEGRCPCCNNDLLWGDLVCFKKGCYKALT